MINNFLKKPLVEKKLFEDFNCKQIDFLGYGSESFIYKDKDTVLKYILYPNLLDMNLLKKCQKIFKNCKQLFSFDIVVKKGQVVISYKQNGEISEYQGGHISEFIDLILFLKKHNLVLTNIKKENFILLNGSLKFVDYGKNIEIYTDEKYKICITRTYQLIKYHFLSYQKFYEMISLSYLKKDKVINYDKKNFCKLFLKRETEDIHDVAIVKFIEKINPKTLLDYGAGKCKIINAFSHKCDCYAFDINIDLIK